ncbi:GFA family protein [Sphingomonas sp. LaA6.9]|uniref:GFA family protein n=1 Tax=Sphingomonas sp. LaA6.9 TaxID=2919914 RepID=UPI001F500DC0|nr:GFA family protein [Sphingomonas sp. LaA6.9]MCJ8157959.1 GFA family protein [Sphingomonas sp. LaA6.9]
MPITGGCRCGAIRYELAVEELPVTYACHCNDCQTWSGSAFAINALLPEALLQITGEVGEFSIDAGERFPSQHLAGAACSTRLANRNAAVPGMVVLRAGTLDRSDELVPAVHIWAKRKQRWLALPKSTPSFDETPSPTEFAAALQGKV